jgi:hypothetical protein
MRRGNWRPGGAAEIAGAFPGGARSRLDGPRPCLATDILRPRRALAGAAGSGRRARHSSGVWRSSRSVPGRITCGVHSPGCSAGGRRTGIERLSAPPRRSAP